jgi:hypothetical protein
MFFDGFPTSTGAVGIQVFTEVSTVANLQWLTWRKPSGKTMAYILCIGGGGGGGGGFTRAAATSGGGGGGGGSSAQAVLLISLACLMDTLYIQVGAGGAGRSSGGGTADSGVLSYVSVAPNTAATNTVVFSGTAAPAGGGTGTGVAVGSAGTAGTVSTIGNALFSGIGQYQFLAGQAGAAGGAVAGAIGPPRAFPATGLMSMGGTGGAGTTAADFAGGLITAAVPSYISELRPQHALAGSNNGSGGYPMAYMLQFWPGLGGASSNAGVGGAGGIGGYGCGGGGGGAGTTGGRGGDGGPGIVIIACW